MNRGEWLKTTGALGAGSILANLETLPTFAAESPGCVWETAITWLKLRHAWMTTMSSNEYRDRSKFVCLAKNGCVAFHSAGNCGESEAACLMAGSPV